MKSFEKCGLQVYFKNLKPCFSKLAFCKLSTSSTTLFIFLPTRSLRNRFYGKKPAKFGRRKCIQLKKQIKQKQNVVCVEFSQYICHLWAKEFLDSNFKGPYADHILIPRAQPEVVHFLISNESPYFFSCKSKISASNSLQFWRCNKNVKLNGIQENNFLFIFIITSSPGVHTFFCLWRINKKLPQGQTSQNAFQRSRSIN